MPAIYRTLKKILNQAGTAVETASHHFISPDKPLSYPLPVAGKEQGLHLRAPSPSPSHVLRSGPSLYYKVRHHSSAISIHGRRPKVSLHAYYSTASVSCPLSCHLLQCPLSDRSAGSPAFTFYVVNKGGVAAGQLTHHCHLYISLYSISATGTFRSLALPSLDVRLGHANNHRKAVGVVRLYA